jgi:hypothetical protein
MAQMTKRLAVKGFDGLNDGLRTDRVTLTIPANFMLIATFDKHPCMQSGRLNLAWNRFRCNGEKLPQILVSIFRPTWLVFVLYRVGR